MAHRLSFDWRQRHRVALTAAAQVAQSLGATENRVVRLDPIDFPSWALTSSGEIPKHHSTSEMAMGIPEIYVPARNTIFLAYALGWAEVLDSQDIFIGVNALDYSGYPDCRPEYIAAFQDLARLATRAAVEGAASAAHGDVEHHDRDRLTLHAPRSTAPRQRSFARVWP